MTNLYTLQDLIEDTDLPTNTVYLWAKQGRISATKLGGVGWRIDADDYPSIVEKCRLEKHGAPGYTQRSDFARKHGINRVTLYSRLRHVSVRTIQGVTTTWLHEQDVLDALAQAGRPISKDAPEPETEPKVAPRANPCPYAGCRQSATVRILPGRGFTFCPRHAEQNRKLLKIKASD